MFFARARLLVIPDARSASRNPVSFSASRWIPAFAGMTCREFRALRGNIRDLSRNPKDMAQIVVPGIRELKQLVGTEVAVGEWLAVTQERIRKFAEATDDRQWIHVDEARAASESPFGTTVAHGFLTLSLLSRLLQQAIEIRGVRMGVNYGLNRVRFTGPVPAGSRVRARFRLAACEDIPQGVQTTWEVTVEREGEAKPVLVAEWLTRRHE
jgi:acyl dehydratase